MRIAGHSSIVVSQRYVHPTPEAVERAFERLRQSGDFAIVEPKATRYSIRYIGTGVARKLLKGL